MQGELRQVGIHELMPTEENPRRLRPQSAACKELVGSVQRHGILQPLVVRRHPQHADRYEVRAGNRRLHAAAAAGLEQVPVVVLELDDREAAEVTVAENLHRHDLSPLEEADAVLLMEAKGWTRSEVAEHLGRSERWVARRESIGRVGTAVRLQLEQLAEAELTMPAALLERVARLSVPSQLAVAHTLEDWQKKRPAAGKPTQAAWECAKRCVDDEEARLLALKTAPWDCSERLADSVCSCCPKRTDSQPLLWDDDNEEGDDAWCLDPLCWERRGQAEALRIFEQYREAKRPLVLLGCSYGAQPHWQGKPVLSWADYCEVGDAGPEDHGLQDGLVVTGPKAGHLCRVNVLHDGHEPERKLKARQDREQEEEQLAHERWHEAIARLQKLIERPEVPAGVTRLQLLAIYGGMIESQADQAWATVDGLMADDQGVVAAWWARASQHVAHLVRHRNHDPHQRDEAALVRWCELCGCTWEELWAQAVEKFPDPPSWAKQQAKAMKQAKKARKAKA